ncbi:MAG: ATP-binding protein, partial [Acidobacteriaceae bacterium]|nr:ATP-binding protein [Acidobacteriaceae bacterium]
MRRRPKRGPNDSESTGKIGQEIPANQPAPLRPTYESAPAQAQTAGLASDAAEPPLLPDNEPDGETAELPPGIAEVVGIPEQPGKLEVETQPESQSTPPPEPQAAQPHGPKGYVVLAIGLPGSGKTTWFKRRGVTPLSSDMLRTILFDDITEQ